MGYPIVNQYQYLGTIINSSLDPRKHMSQLANKFNFIKTKLTAIRRLGDLTTNRNIFNLIIMPSCRMVASYFDFTN